MSCIFMPRDFHGPSFSPPASSVAPKFLSAVVTAADYAVAGDLNVLNGKALYTQRLDVRPRTARFQRSKCFSAKKLTSYSDQSALAVSHVDIHDFTIKMQHYKRFDTVGDACRYLELLVFLSHTERREQLA